MSAIWGAISFTEKKLPEAIPTVFRRAFETCVLDKIEEMKTDTVYLGCGHRFVTEESKRENLPCKENGLFFTADVILDNRGEVIKTLGMSENEGERLPDGELLLRMYQKDRETALNCFLGAYAFVVYDEEVGAAELVIDAVGDRVVYYAMKEGILYLSSLLMPLAELTKATLNDRWLTDFLAMDHLFMINETEETPFEGIYRVAPAHAVKVSAGGVEKQRYWNPIKTVKPLKLKSDEAYHKAFRDLFHEVVASKLRTSGPVSALLSGGYDSTAVVSVVSKLLKEKGHRILSYTSVPLRSYQTKGDGYYVEDETELVKKTVEFLGNVDPSYVDMPGINPWNGHEEGMKRIEMPYKSSLNFLWIPECMRLAKEKGATIMFTGSYGNTSISYENVEVYLNELKRKGRFVRLHKEICAFAEKYGVDARVLKERLRKKKRGFREDRRWTSLYRRSFVRPNMVAKSGTDERMIQLKRRMEEATTYEKQREFMMHELSLRQIGEVSTKNSLATGVLLRDPTKDKRIIEFCMSLPMEQFNKSGESRRLVSCYLKEDMPPHLFLGMYRGKQSADFSYRLSLEWDKIRKEWMERCRECADSSYVDTGYEYVCLKKYEDITSYSQMDLTRHVYTQMVLEYEKKYRKMMPKISEKTELMPLISIIIPVYNVKEHLERCLDSVEKQTYTNLEVILVDDGSIDGSGILCDRYVAKSPKYKVLHKENGGVSSARNAGLEMATGEYIGFVDSDDFIEPTMFQELIEGIQRYDVPLAGCGIKCTDYDGKDITTCEGFTFVYHGGEMLETFLGYSRRTTSVAISVWNKLFHRSLLENKRFMDVRKYEDMEFVWTVLAECSGAVFIDKPLYYYEKKMDGLHKQSYAGKELLEFIALEESILKAIHRNNRIRREGYLNHVRYVYLTILDWLLGKKACLERVERKTAKKFLLGMHNDIREALLQSRELRKKEKVIAYIGVFSTSLYRILSKYI